MKLNLAHVVRVMFFNCVVSGTCGFIDVCNAEQFDLPMVRSKDTSRPSRFLLMDSPLQQDQL